MRSSSAGRSGFRRIGETGAPVQDRLEDDRRRVAGEGRASGGHLVEHRAAGEDVGPRVEGLAARLLGGHVRDGADRHPGTRQVLLGHRGRQGAVPRAGAAGLRPLRQAEVEQLGLAALGHEDVGGLDVPVHDAARVRGLEGVGDLDAEIEQRVELEGSRGEAVAQRLAFEQLHGDEGPPVVLVDVVDRADVGVLERGGGARLALQPLEGLRVARQLLGQELQRDASAELQVLGLVDDAHAAAAQLREHAVVRDGLSDHRWRASVRAAFYRFRSPLYSRPGAEARRHQEHPRHRVGADRHRPGVRVRLLRAPRPSARCAARATGSSSSTRTPRRS